MAEIKIILDEKEKEESEDLISFLKPLSKREKLYFKGFVEGYKAILETSKH